MHGIRSREEGRGRGCGRGVSADFLVVVPARFVCLDRTVCGPGALIDSRAGALVKGEGRKGDGAGGVGSLRSTRSTQRGLFRLEGGRDRRGGTKARKAVWRVKEMSRLVRSL